jgi:iron complex transport system substrate-binding protein
MGLCDELVGVTHECDWPAEVIGKPVMTHSVYDLEGTPSRTIHQLVDSAVHGGSSLYALDDEALEAAEPDLILTQELCNVCAVSYREVNDVARAIDADIKVVSLEPTSIEGIFNTITTVGALTEAEDAAVDLVEHLRARLGAVEQTAQRRRDSGHLPPRVVALEWLDPPFAVGHWVPEQISRAGGWDLLGEAGAKSVQTTWQAVREVDPEMLVLMPCGFHLEQTLSEWGRTPRPAFWDEIEAIRRGQIFAVDGSAYFSRPGPRIVDGIELLAEIFDPDAFVDIAPLGSWTPLL